MTALGFPNCPVWSCERGNGPGITTDLQEADLQNILDFLQSKGSFFSWQPFFSIYQDLLFRVESWTSIIC